MATTEEEIYNGLKDVSFIKRLVAVRNLHQLKGNEPLMIIDGLLEKEDNLAMKIEALGVIPVLVNPSSYGYVSKILEKALTDNDPEIVRNSLRIIQRIPSIAINENVIKKVISILENDDTDMQYAAISCLMYLRERISKDLLIKKLAPFSTHQNDALKKIADEAIESLT